MTAKIVRAKPQKVHILNPNSQGALIFSQLLQNVKTI